MSKAFWISRDTKAIHGQKFYVVSKNKIKRDSLAVNFYGDLDLCEGKFEKLTGIKIKPGQQKKFKLVEVER